MSTVNSFMNSVFSVIWSPFENLHPWVGLAVFSLVIGVLALIVYKYVSNQAKITSSKDGYKGHLLAIWLFQDDLKVVLMSLVKTLRHIAVYMFQNLKPVLVMIIPVMLIIAQMQMRLAYRPIPVGEKFIATVDMTDASEEVGVTNLQLEVPDGIEVVNQVRVPSEHRVAFQLRATKPLEGELRFTLGEETTSKRIQVASAEDDGSTPLVPLAYIRGSSAMDQFMFPTEAEFGANSVFEKIAFLYPTRPLQLFGIDFSFGAEWGMMLTVFVITILAALALKGVFKVDF